MNGNKERKAFCQSSMTRDIQNKMIKIIEILESDAQSFDFLEPVDYIAFEIHDYPSIITRPMDLGTIKVLYIININHIQIIIRVK